MMQNNISYIFVLIFAALSAAGEVSSDSLRALSFSDLMDIEVTVASRKKESLYDAPGIVSSYSSEDIQSLGYYTLTELANITPAYSTSFLYGEKGFETRGVKTSSFNNNRHLVLIDGIPVNHVRANKAPAGEELSLYSAERVEFLRGPASALYGTGAYYGVINVIPEIPEFKGTHFKSRIGFGGTIAERRADATIAHRGKSQQFYSAATYYQNEASKKYAGTGSNENFIYWDDTKALSFQGNYRLTDGVLNGLGIGTIFLSRSSGLGEHWNGDFSHELNDLRWETFISYVRFNRALTDLLSMDTYLKYNRSTETGWYTPFSDSSYTNFNDSGALFYNYEVPINDYQYFLEFDYTGPFLTINGGIDFDWRYQPGEDGGTSFYVIEVDSGGPYRAEVAPRERSDDYTTASLFLQLSTEIPLFEGLILTGGIRNDMGKGGKNNYSQLSPRVAVVQRFTDFLNLKLLYGTALISPGIKEIELNKEVLSRSPELESQLPNLEAETFSTFEGGLVYYNTLKVPRNIFNVKAEVAGFINRSVNELKSEKFFASSGKTENGFVNTNDSITSQGLECELRAESDFGIGVFGNYSYAKAHDRNDNRPEDIPYHKVSAGITFRSEKLGIYSSLIGRHVQEYSTRSGDYLHGYSVADMTVGWISPMKVGVDLHISNLLDEQYSFPVESTPVIPMRGRQVLLSVTAQF